MAEGDTPKSSAPPSPSKAERAAAPAAAVLEARSTDTDANREAVSNDSEYQASLETLNASAKAGQSEEQKIIIDPHGHTKDAEDVKTAVSSGGLPYNNDPEEHGLPGPITGHSVNTDGSEEVVIDTRVKFWRRSAGEGEWIDASDLEAMAAARKSHSRGDMADGDEGVQTRDDKGQNVRKS